MKNAKRKRTAKKTIPPKGVDIKDVSKADAKPVALLSKAERIDRENDLA